MARFVVVEELHVTVRVRDDLSDEMVGEMNALLQSKPFRSRLLDAVKQALAGFPALTGGRVQISR
ncbi:hypothetical protein [Zavarzinella formosa]|uniref:hypothetical protein n=1 Tax=Zavarzinella formosa TaxID=360055 RepID=UPI000304F7F5|nr:hypothetical protein [Zavarzinella formosa]